MIPGQITNIAKISPLKRLSPSRFLALKKCALREVWASDRAPLLLPLSPKARLGTVIHAILELSGKGQLGSDPSLQVDRVWANLISETEGNMSSSWLDSPLVPLSRSVADFEVRRLRARKIALAIAEASNSYVRSDLPSTGLGFEVWVETPDRTVGGRIDEIAPCTDGLKLRDYKTGLILENDKSDENPTVKAEYQIQLKLYAALYASSFGKWPTRLEVVDLDGREFEVPCDPSRCEDLLREAREVLVRINNSIASAASPQQAVRNLADPSPSNCNGCAFRPGCPAYRTTRTVSQLADWPKDVFGRVQYVRTLANGRCSLGVNLATDPTTLVRVRNLEATASRHPALGRLKEGDLVGVFNLKADQEGRDFSELSMTTIYCLSSSAPS